MHRFDFIQSCAAAIVLSLPLTSCHTNSKALTIHSDSSFFTTNDQITLKKTSGYVPVPNNGKLYYEEMGEGTPVILLHGHTLDHRMWLPQLPILCGSYRVITPDLRGYGLSSKQGENIQFTHTDDVIAFMNHLNIQKAHIIGLSMGSFIASEMLALYPERFITATLVSGSIRKMPGPSTPFSEEEIAKANATIEANKQKGVDVWKCEWIDQLVKGGGSQAENIRKAITEQINEWDAWQLLHREGRIYYASEAMDTLKTKRPTIPTLIISGDMEHKGRNSMLPYLPNGRQVVILDCGHMSNMERPKEFNELILEHLK